MSLPYFLIEYFRLIGPIVAFGSCQLAMLCLWLFRMIVCTWWVVFFPLYIYLFIALLLAFYILLTRRF